MSGDWQCGKSLAECNQYMLDHEINTDVTFIIDNKDDEDNTGSDSVRYNAHKHMLVSRSPVFYAMLCGEMAEQGDIKVKDARPEPFKELLNFIYTDEMEISPKNVFDILYLSRKYIIPQLTSKCIDYLRCILNPENACLILDHTWMYNDETLIEKCIKVIQVNTETAFKPDTMLDIRNETLLKILDSQILAITEVEVFNACVRWANHQLESKDIEIIGSNIRNVLGDCIRKIGYANIAKKHFYGIVIPVGVLNLEEENAVFKYMANDKLHSPPVNFLCTNRKQKLPLKILFSNHIIIKLIADVVVKVTVMCDTDIQIKSLFVGRRTGNTKIISTEFDQKPLIGVKKKLCSYNGMEWKLDPAIVLQQNQAHDLEFTFYNDESNKKEPVYVVKSSEIVVDDDIVKIKLQSDTSFLPLIGCEYTLAIPK